MEQVLSDYSASISELKKNPTALLNQAEGSPIAILNHNVPAAYLIPADTYKWLMDKLDDVELAQAGVAAQLCRRTGLGEALQHRSSKHSIALNANGLPGVVRTYSQ